jgi:RNA polymerase sigma factor (sigma-70 family)
MDTTSPSLLGRLRHQSDPRSWQRFFDLYFPWIRDWLCRHHSLSHQDAEDLTQDVLSVVLRELPGFSYDPRKGSFRGWLRAITVNRLRAFWKAGKFRPVPTGNSDFAQMLDQLEDPRSGLSHLWDQEHDGHVISQILEAIEPEFEPTTWRAFRRVVIEGARPADVAAELGLTRNAVFIAKSRVMRRLRQETQGLTG